MTLRQRTRLAPGAWASRPGSARVSRAPGAEGLWPDKTGRLLRSGGTPSSPGAGETPALPGRRPLYDIREKGTL